MAHLKNLSNTYVDMANQAEMGIFDSIPKSVWAGIAISFAMRLAGERIDLALAEVIKEWIALKNNGIVPQIPPAYLLNRRFEDQP